MNFLKLKKLGKRFFREINQGIYKSLVVTLEGQNIYQFP